jgi:uncharacterized protein YjdB
MRARYLPLLIVPLFGTGCEDSDLLPEAVARVDVVSPASRLDVGGTLQLTATARGSSGTILADRPISWASSDTVVASVSAGGLVTARSAGTATISAKSEGRTGSTAITIDPVVVPVGSVELSPDSGAVLRRGQSLRLTAVVRDAAGAELAGRAVEWASDAPGVAGVSTDGLVTAIAAGRAVIFASSGGRSASVKVEVLEPVASVSLLPDAGRTLRMGETFRWTAVVRDSAGRELPDRVVEWSSDTPAIASVAADGLVTARAVGLAVITARSEGRAASVAVEVRESYAYQLVFDTGYGTNPEIFSLRIDDPAAEPARLLGQHRGWDAAPSPDGSHVAYTCTNGTRTAICVSDRAGHSARVLTSSLYSADQPAWSPDGSRIAFRRWAAGGPPGPFNPSQIWTVHAEGGDHLNVSGATEEGTWHETPTWSPAGPDGSFRIAYSQQSISGGYRVGRIVTMRADGSDRRAVTPASEYLETEPAWSPDGKTIVFVRNGVDAFGDLWLVNSTGGNERPLLATQFTDEQASPAWSPDGLYIAFSSKHELAADGRWSYQIYTVRSHGSHLTRRTDRGDDKERPAWLRVH